MELSFTRWKLFGYTVLLVQTKSIFVTSKAIFLHRLEVRLAIWVSTYSLHDTLFSWWFGAHVLAVSVQHCYHFSVWIWPPGHWLLCHLMSLSGFTPFFPFIFLINPLWKQTLRLSFSGRWWYKSNFNVLLRKFAENIVGGFISSKETLPNETHCRQQS